ncbi:MBL fold metallo-hydrolase [Streptomyces sp. NPDC090108]|uniref:MBL fold metallo-hydrolase n=1 Tax=Streptomyces sp. NPDC090108 TaxID=3365947 RepID=UPI0038280657
MDVVPLLPRLRLLRFPVGQAYLWSDDGELTLVDAGPPGSGPAVLDALADLGHAPGGLRRIVLTHFHVDHAGGAGELAAATGAEVFAHALDPPFVTGELPGPPPVFEDREVPLHEAVSRLLPENTPTPARRVTTVGDGDVLGFGDGARVIHVPGHTEGSVALHLPAEGVLFTGDTVAASPVDGSVMPGVFNLDRARLLDSFHRLSALGAEVACFGHGDPVVGGASAVLREAADRHPAAG